MGARALAYEPTDRFESAAALRDALDGFLRGRTRRRLLEEADRHRAQLLTLLAAHAPASELNEVFGACRFAYRQALVGAPGPEGILAALQDVTHAMLQRALEDGRISAAEAVLAELTAPDPDLVAACARARAALSARNERLSRLEHEIDETVGDRVRGWLALVPSALWLAIHLPLGWLHRHQGLDIPVQTYALFLGLCLAIVPFFWSTLFQHPINRRTATGALTLVFVFLGILVLASVLDMPLQHTFVLTSWVACCTWVVGAVSVEPVQGVAAAVHAVFLPLFVLFPDWLYELAGWSTFLAHGGLGVVWIRRAARRPAS